VGFSIPLLAVFLAASPQEELQTRSREILRRNQENEISTAEARRQVQLLLKDLKKWSEEGGLKLQSRTRAVSWPATGRGEVLSVDRCALFYEEDPDELCPLDVSRSEIWGAFVVFCRYLCVPEAPDEDPRDR
jgi:hypothetical protein